MRYEVKIGILALVAISFSFWGYKFIQGSNLFSSSNYLTAYYDSVGGLTVGTPVQISGVNVGSVSAIYLNQNENSRVDVTLDIQDDINIPKDAVALIAADGVLGGKLIDLNFSRPCLGNGDCAEDGDVIEGKALGIFASFFGGDPDADPADEIQKQVKSAIDSLEYTLFSPESDNPIARSSQDLAVTMENLKQSTARLQGILDRNAGAINGTMSNLQGLTNTLASKQEAIAGIIDNAESTTNELAKVELEETVQEIQKTIKQLQGTLGEADRAIGGVATLMNDVKSGKGTLGKLLTDDKIYNRLDRASGSIDTLATDFQERPYRYIPFKSRRRVLRLDRKDRKLEEAGGRDVKAIDTGGR